MSGDALAWSGWVALAYLLGSVPVGLLIGLAKGIDIRTHGSGNIGATNARRVLGARAGNVCLALDMLKGAAPTLAAGWWSGALAGRATSEEVWLWLLVAVAAVIGHMFPVWLRFRGGKGVATGFGAVASVFPVLTIAAGAAFVVWSLATRMTRYVGVGSCVAAVSMPFAAWAAASTLGRGDGLPAYLSATSALAALVVWRHRGNLARTLRGEEPRIGQPLDEAEAADHADRASENKRNRA